MNFPAAARLFSEHIITSLWAIPNAMAPLTAASRSPPPPALLVPRVVPHRAEELAAYLHLGREAVFAFLGEGTAYERLHRAWFARYFADGWRMWLVEQELPVAVNFLSTNQYSCIKLNAESLLLFYHWLCASPKLRRGVPASVFGAGSQQNENLFRTTRFCTDPNFTVEEFLLRVSKAQEFALTARRNDGLFRFAEHHKHTSPDHIRRAPVYLEDSYNEHHARECLASALAMAEKALSVLGITLCKSPFVRTPCPVQGTK
jgi:hypothetical protein